MMLFKPEHIKLIHCGMKTQTRRLWKKARAKVGSIHMLKLKLYEKETHGLILIKGVRQENLLDITEKDAIKEGGYSRESYLKKWFEINPKSPPNPKVFVVDFFLVT